MNALALALLLALPLSAAAPAPVAPPGCETQKVAVKTRLTLPDGKTIRVDVVDTPASREKGLMCVVKMPSDYGMLFVFPSEQDLTFWMKDTLIPLDIIWIGADKTINVIHEKLPATTVDTPDEKITRAAGLGQYVLELRSGSAARRKLKAGDKLKFSVKIPAM